MKALLVIALFGSAACVTGRVHVGPVVDTDGNVGFRGGITFGLGFATDDENAVQVSETISGGAIGTDEETAGTLDVGIAVDYISMPERRGGVGFRYGLRFGGHGEYADDDTGWLAFGFNTGMLKPLSTKRGGSGCHEKGLDLFCWRGTSWTSVGFEAQLDLLHDTENSETKALGYLGVVLEYDSIDD